jgi:hypothetical protein
MALRLPSNNKFLNISLALMEDFHIPHHGIINVDATSSWNMALILYTLMYSVVNPFAKPNISAHLARNPPH